MLPVVDSPSRLEAKSSMKLCTTLEGCWASQSRTACGKADIRLGSLEKREYVAWDQRQAAVCDD